MTIGDYKDNLLRKMNMIEIIEYFEDSEFVFRAKKINVCRKKTAFEILDSLDVKVETHTYKRGENLIATIGKAPYIGLGSHYDVVEGSPGANDNASAIAVSLDILRKAKEDPLENLGLKAFFFDEEEEYLRGSRAYVKDKGYLDLIGLYNMELVGAGENIAIWVEGNIFEGNLVRILESNSKNLGVNTYRVPNISNFMRNSGDHESFIEAGMKEAFCITAITNRDVELIKKFRLIQGDRISNTKNEYLKNTLDLILGGTDIFSSSDLFKHYHKSSDSVENINEKSLQMTSDVLWNSIKEIDKNYVAES